MPQKLADDMFNACEKIDPQRHTKDILDRPKKTIPLKDTGILKLYNASGNRPLVPVEAKTGDKLQLKFNGRRGGSHGRIIGFSDEKPEYVKIMETTVHWTDKPSAKGKWISIHTVSMRITTFQELNRNSI